MQSFIHTLRWPAMLLIAMSGLIVSVANLQAQAIPAKLAGSDRAPSELRGFQPDTGRPPSDPPSQSQLVQVLQQRGISVDAQALAANRGKRKIRGSSRAPSEMNQPGEARATRTSSQRPSQAALLQRMRQLPGGQARLDEARRRGASLGTTTGHVPQSGRNLDSSAADNLVLASMAGPTWGPSSSELSPTYESGDWSVYFSGDRGISGSYNQLVFFGADVQRTNKFKVRSGGCIEMWFKVPADGWYLIWYIVGIQPRAKLVVKTGDTVLTEFTGDGSVKVYPDVVELGAGHHTIKACNPHSGDYVNYYMSGAYDIP